MLNKYQQVRREGESFNERNDCSVVAASIACRITYAAAHDICHFAGRRRRGRFDVRGKLVPDLVRRGFKVTETDVLYTKRQKNGSRYTMRTIGELFTKGYYIVYVRGHVAAMVNGEVLDWSAGGKRRVFCVWKVVKPKGLIV